MKKFIPLLISLGLLTGCHTTGQPSSPYGGWYNFTKYTLPPTYSSSVTQKKYNASYDKVWEALLDAISQYGMPVANMDKSSGFIVVRGKDSTNIDNLVDCGTDSSYGQLAQGVTQLTHRSGGYRREMAVGITLNIRVKKINNKTTSIIINPSYELAVAVLNYRQIWLKEIKQMGVDLPADFTSYQLMNNSYEKHIRCVPTYKECELLLNTVQDNLRN